MYRNAILRVLPAEEIARLEPKLTLVPLSRHQNLMHPGVVPDVVYFIVEGVVIASLPGGKRAQPAVGIFGPDGVSAISSILQRSETPFEETVALGGKALCVSAGWLLEDRATPELNRRVLGYAAQRLRQAASTIRDAACYTTHQRLARLLCLLHDRIDGDTIMLTHDRFASWLAIRRPGITVATHLLEGMRAIRASRGQIIIRDRSLLENASGGAYGAEDRDGAKNSWWRLYPAARQRTSTEAMAERRLASNL